MLARPFLATLMAAVCACALLHSPAGAAWPKQSDQPVNAFYPWGNHATLRQVATSVLGGCYVAIMDTSGGAQGAIWETTQLKVQWVDGEANPRWGGTGTIIDLTNTLAPGQELLSYDFQPDSSGGVFVSYQHITMTGATAHASIRLTRIRANGSLAWPAPLNLSSPDNGGITRGSAAAPGGSAIILWTELSGGAETLYAQRFDSTGTAMWPSRLTLGTTLSSPSMTTRAPGLGKVATAFTGPDSLVRCVMYNDAGQVLSPPGGVAVLSPRPANTGIQSVEGIGIVPFDGNCYVAFRVPLFITGFGVFERIHAQVISPAFTVALPSGRLLGTHVYTACSANAVVGGNRFYWSEHSGDGHWRTRTALVLENGDELPPGGLLVDDLYSSSPMAAAVVDSNGVLFALTQSASLFDPHFFARSLNRYGVLSPIRHVIDSRGVGPDGVFRFSAAEGGGLYLNTSLFMGSPVYRVSPLGCPGVPTPRLLNVTDVPNDQGGAVQLCWEASCGDDHFTTQYLLQNRPAGAPPEIGWNTVGGVDAIGLGEYCSEQPTYADSGATGAANYEWQVLWDDQAGFTHASNVVVGHSVDNIAPAPVSGLTVEFHPGTAAAGLALAATGYNQLRWTPSPSADVMNQRVYRGDYPGFVPGASSLVADLPASAAEHQDPSSHAGYYKVIAVDGGNNGSSPAGSPPVPVSTNVPYWFTDFESGMPPEISAPGASVQGSQGYAPLGRTVDNTFGPNFLRYDAVTLYDTRLVLRNLPAHTNLSLGFLLALIDSWDGTELFQVTVDGTMLFNHWFQLASGDNSNYLAPPGALLSSGTNLGFTNSVFHSRDRAYDLSLEPAFQNIPHTADSVVVVWKVDAVSGGAASQWQGGSDESWAIDNVRISLLTGGLDVPAADTPRTLELSGASPNPSRDGRLRIHFGLATTGEARLELFDVSGRRLASRDVGTLGAGRHSVDLGGEQRLQPGLYLIRLRQGSAVKTSRAIVMQ